MRKYWTDRVMGGGDNRVARPPKKGPSETPRCRIGTLHGGGLATANENPAVAEENR